MDYTRVLLTKVQTLVRPGSAWNTQAGSYPGGGAGHAAVVTGAGSHVSWSGTTATVHTMLRFSTEGHGFGSEFS